MRKFKTQNANNNIILKSLTNEEFDTLINNVQFLKSSQIKYIIRKFSIPINNNKINLMNLLLLFQSLRHETILTSIYYEIKKILSRTEISFYSTLQIVPYGHNFASPPNFIYQQSNYANLFGPIFVCSGQNSGKFNFQCFNQEDETDSLVNISFLFLNGNSHQFEMEAEFNGFPIEISIDDPYPQPIDISDLINYNSEDNIINIKNIRSPQPMMICIRNYIFYNIEEMTSKIVGRPVNVENEDFYVHSNNCIHNQNFSLVSFISKSYITGEWKCPICFQSINPFNLNIFNIIRRK